MKRRDFIKRMIKGLPVLMVLVPVIGIFFRKKRRAENFKEAYYYRKVLGR
ncbi:MAG: hypothetical protein KKH98_12415 [Spirochaetes bacterium]|nr:hypothetical protein [Spirochaetota bacterium]